MTEQLITDLIIDPENFSRQYLRQPPEFLYNDPEVCCLLRNSSRTQGQDSTCPGINKGYLGKRGKIGVPYLVEIYRRWVSSSETSPDDDIDNHTNNRQLFIVKTSQPGSLSLVYRNDPSSNIQDFVTTLDKSPTRCGFPDLDDLHYLGADEFTNEMLIGLILTYYLRDWNEEMITLMREPSFAFYPQVEYLTSTICQDNTSGLPFTSNKPIGVHLQEYCDLGTLHDFATSSKTQEYRQPLTVLDFTLKDGDEFRLEVVQDKILLQIIRQVVTGLHLLQEEFDFNHGDLKVTNVFVSSQSASGKYQDVDISAPFTCKIADYGKSSLTLDTKKGPVRIYCRSWLADRYLSVIPFRPEVGRELRYGVKEEPFFIVNNLLNVHLYTRSRHQGIPFYRAFDTYTFFVSLLIIPAYYYSFFNSKDLVKHVWNVLWFPGDDELMRRKILDRHHDRKAESISICLDLLRGVRLRCDVTERLVMNLV